MSQERSEVDFLAGSSEMATLMRNLDWSRTPLGPARTWPRSLQIALRILLTSKYAMWLGWGPDLTFFYNDSYGRMTLGKKHPWALGRSAREVWAEIWTELSPRIETVFRTGEATWDEGLMLFLERSGFREETYHTFSYSPVPDDHGGVGGMLCVVTEETERRIGDRQLELLRKLASDLAATNTEDEVFTVVSRRLEACSRDLPFTLIYVFDDTQQARLACASGIPPGDPAAPHALAVGGSGAAWPANAEFAQGTTVTLDDLPTRFPRLPSGAWDQSPRQAVLAPLARQGQEKPAGFLVAAVNPYRPLDMAYRGFVELLAGQIAAALSNARAYEEEKRRAEALAELDRAKTAFFSNVSHEFRTPLTLLLAPVEDALADDTEPLPGPQRERLETAHRNSVRLLKLVNTLLDFARIEAGRVQAVYEPTDLAVFTAELASNFRSACERAGLRLVIDCPPLPEPVYVDRDMWEKVVLNLMSNAFKFTLDGEIRVACRSAPGAVEVAVGDSGTGIPEGELTKLFNRFHRVEGARGRTHEGTGIGLALVQELVRLHGGSVRAESVFGKGSTFTVRLPLGTDHLPPDRVGGSRTLASTALGANPFVEEALRWLPGNAPSSELSSGSRAPEHSPPPPGAERPRVLLADDNADMREYVRRLLADRHEVVAVPDGMKALEAAREQRPDLVLTDVMMPNLDGFGLLQALRADPRTRTIPLIMLSARAGEEARVEGLGAGADDYLTKPFSARELVARVGGTLALARARREALRREEELRAETTSVLESITDGFVAVDRDFRFTYMNAEAERLFRLPRAEVLGLDHFDVFPTLRATPVETEFRRAMTERVPVKFEHYYTPGGKWFEVDVYPAKDGGLAVYFRDVTERKRRTEQIQSLAAAAVAVNATLALTDTLQEVTDRARQIVGAHQAVTVVTDPSGAPIVSAVSLSDKYSRWRGDEFPRDRTGLWAIVCRSNQPRRLTQEELEAHPDWYRPPQDSADGPPLRGWLAAPLMARDGRNLGLVQLSDKNEGEFTDGDEAVLVQLAQTASVAIENGRLYKSAQEARAEAEAANRMKDQFLATLSHELRTPLNAILGWARILQSGKVDAATVKEGLDTIERNSKVQAQLIEDLLDISRIISGKLRLDVQRVSLVEVIEASLASVAPAADAKEIRVQRVLDPLAGPVSGDPARLQQVVWNLLSNAVKFTPKGGRVQVLLERVNSHVEISVIDTGQGIKPEFLPFVFDRFRQADASTTRRHGGLGLGLSIVKHLVEMHGGAVRVKSPGEGEGTTFTVMLPITVIHESPAEQARPTAPLTEESNGEPARLDGIKVLVVDDECDARELVKRILGTCGAEVRTAGSAAEALHVLEPFRPDLLLSDVGMPEQDGYDLIRQVRARGWTSRELPAAALTAFARGEDRRKALLAGFQMHVVKPVDPEELIAVVASLAGRTGSG